LSAFFPAESANCCFSAGFHEKTSPGNVLGAHFPALYLCISHTISVFSEKSIVIDLFL
jgi:hypothetical protein